MPLGMLPPNSKKTPVTFGTPVVVPKASNTSLVFTMSGVVTGQPIVVVYVCNSATVPTVADTFSTPYTWTLVDALAGVSDGYIRTLIGTGGVGTSGVITLGAVAGQSAGGVATPCIGASTAAGLSAVDVHGANAGLSISQTPSTGGEGAVAGVLDRNGVLTGFPASPWVVSNINVGGTNTVGGSASYSNPASGVALAATWTESSAPNFQVSAMVIVKHA